MKKIAFVFPGQGSQTVGMLADLAANYPIIQQTFATASQLLGYDLWQLTQAGPEEQLNQTTMAQPALLTAGVAIYRLWQQQGGATPTICAGHSLGEYTALVCAGSIAFEDAVTLVRDRGQFMQEAVPAGVGAMVAIVGLDDVTILDVCAAAAQEQILTPANYNSPGQIVLAGDYAAAERAVILAKTAGAKIAKLLAVSVPSHCDLMRGAAEKLQQRLNNTNIQAPTIPVIHNADVALHSEPDAIRTALVQQLYSPINWTKTMQHCQDTGIECALECGPGKVLTGLNKRIVSGMVLELLGSTANFQQALELTK